MRESRICEGLKLPQPVGVVDANPFCHEQSPFALLSVEPHRADSPRPTPQRRKATLAQTPTAHPVRNPLQEAQPCPSLERSEA